jgi:hypothetical protein
LPGLGARTLGGSGGSVPSRLGRQSKRKFAELGLANPLVNVNRKLLNMAIEIEDLPMKDGDFSIVMLVYQRVYAVHICTLNGLKIF